MSAGVSSPRTGTSISAASSSEEPSGSDSPAYRGRKTATAHPRSAIDFDSAPTTSASPPTLANGTDSALRIATRKRWVIRFSGRDAGSELDVAQVLGRLFGRRWVDVEAGSPLEACHFRELGHDFDVPVIVIEAGVATRSAVDDEVVMRTVQRLVDA